jgi:hypothetical protein
MNKKTLSLLAVASIALLSACSNTIENTEQQARLNVLVRNSADGNPVNSATVTLLSTGESKATDAAGAASFGSVPAGTHRLRIEATGYASTFAQTEIGASENFANEASQQVSLNPSTAKLIGYIYYTDKDGNSKPASAAKIRLTLGSSNLVNRTVDKTADADGKYEASDLPTGEVTVSALEQEFEGTTYASVSSSILGLTHNTTKAAPSLTYSSKISAAAFVLQSYTKELENNTSSIVLVFSDAIDIAKNALYTIMVTDNSRCLYYEMQASPTIARSPCERGNNIALDADVTYSEDRKTVTIKKLGKWGSETPYVHIRHLQSINGNVYYSYSSQGSNYYDGMTLLNISFKKKELSDVTNFKVATTSITTSTTTIDLRWDGVKDADGYVIYAKANKVGDEYTSTYHYSDEACTIVDNKTTCSASIPFSGSPFVGEGANVEFIIQAFNSDSKTLLSAPAAKTIAKVTP